MLLKQIQCRSTAHTGATSPTQNQQFFCDISAQRMREDDGRWGKQWIWLHCFPNLVGWNVPIPSKVGRCWDHYAVLSKDFLRRRSHLEIWLQPFRGVVWISGSYGFLYNQPGVGRSSKYSPYWHSLGANLGWTSVSFAMPRRQHPEWHKYITNRDFGRPVLDAEIQVCHATWRNSWLEIPKKKHWDGGHPFSPMVKQYQTCLGCKLLGIVYDSFVHPVSPHFQRGTEISHYQHARCARIWSTGIWTCGCEKGLINWLPIKIPSGKLT